MKVAIHQPNYFPWIGYLDKMVKCDQFILLDDVQLSDNDYMHRNRFLDINGNVKYMTIPFQKKDYMKQKYKDIKINNTLDWQKKNAAFLGGNYKNAPYFNEINQLLMPLFNKHYNLLIDAILDSIELLRSVFEINTPMVLQSQLEYNQNSRKSDLVIALCKSCDADTYYSGRGAIEYMDSDQFEENGISIEYQQVNKFEYSQINSKEFIFGVSILDMLFNCGLEKSKQLFWDSIKEGAHI
ncbi:WbqC family protein [Cohnella faecalis]|uniref:WbqC family protein n=1 Tax=Cohnella faecalis TaxID=2315694 RepID=A0A398CYJ7_9BACL|nr:WbqC family protein [Cohnella faecalis]RIE04301.1 hypothetical protein D3H35_06725 [Cohnella faecalis]